MDTLNHLAQFRQQVYQTFTQRPAALLELIDAVAQTPRPHSPAELSLAMQRHWSTLYDALRHGELDLAKLRPLLVKTAATAAPYRVAGCRVVLVDHTGFPRPTARTLSERERYHGPNSTLPIGHRYSWLSQVVDPDTACVATWCSICHRPRVSPIRKGARACMERACSSTTPAPGPSQPGVPATRRP